MYSRFFGFREQPFGVSPDPRFFFPSSQHAEATASLYYAIAERRGLAVLVGPPGLGKTSVLVNLAERLAAEARVAFFVHPRFEGGAVLESVLMAMGIEPQPDPLSRLRAFHAFLLGLFREGKTCVVIFDEAQHLNPESLETIRMLSNFETPRQKLIQFVLAGQPGLVTLLRTPECEQILQRVSIVARLQPLSAGEVESYIAHRLAVAGAAQGSFSQAAIRTITAASLGVPRNINTICFNALTLAFADSKNTVDEQCVAEAVRDGILNDIAPPVDERGSVTSRTPLDFVREALMLSTSISRAFLRRFLLVAAVMIIGLVCARVVWILR